MDSVSLAHSRYSMNAYGTDEYLKGAARSTSDSTGPERVHGAWSCSSSLTVRRGPDTFLRIWNRLLFRSIFDSCFSGQIVSINSDALPARALGRAESWRFQNESLSVVASSTSHVCFWARWLWSPGPQRWLLRFCLSFLLPPTSEITAAYQFHSTVLSMGTAVVIASYVHGAVGVPEPVPLSLSHGELLAGEGAPCTALASGTV